MKKYDAIIIGFGKGGKTLAAEFAKRQKTVAIVERSDRMYGGTCINSYYFRLDRRVEVLEL